MIAAAVVAGAILAGSHNASPQLREAPARFSLSAWPSRVEVQAGAARVVHLRAPGRHPLRLEARVAGYALDLRGRPRIAAAADAASWVSVRPRRITVGRGGAALVVSTRRVRTARPGDHSALVLLSAATPSAGGVLVRIRIGLVVSVRVPGALVHRLELRAARVRRSGRQRLVELTVANRGNVVEPVDAAHLRLTLLRGDRVVARLRPEARRLLPRATGLVDLRFAGQARGRVTARLELSLGAGPPRIRSFPLRL